MASAGGGYHHILALDIKTLVHDIGKRLTRNEDEIESALRLLDAHWIGTLSDWRGLSPEHKKQVGLPLLLSSSLDALVQEEEEEEEEEEAEGVPGGVSSHEGCTNCASPSPPSLFNLWR